MVNVNRIDCIVIIIHHRRYYYNYQLIIVVVVVFVVAIIIIMNNINAIIVIIIISITIVIITGLVFVAVVIIIIIVVVSVIRTARVLVAVGHIIDTEFIHSPTFIVRINDIWQTEYSDDKRLWYTVHSGAYYVFSQFPPGSVSKACHCRSERQRVWRA